MVAVTVAVPLDLPLIRPFELIASTVLSLTDHVTALTVASSGRRVALSV